MRAPRTIAALAAVAVVTVAAGCGSSNDLPKDIPPEVAQSLQKYLSAVATDCNDLHDPSATKSAVDDYMTALASVPETVDPDVRKVLTETGARLQSLARDGTACGGGATGASGLSGVVPTASTTTTDTTTTTTPTTTSTTTSTTTPTAPEKPTPPAGNGNQGPAGNDAPPPGGTGGAGPSGGSGDSSGSGGIGAG